MLVGIFIFWVSNIFLSIFTTFSCLRSFNILSCPLYPIIVNIFIFIFLGMFINCPTVFGEDIAFFGLFRSFYIVGLFRPFSVGLFVLDCAIQSLKPAGSHSPEAKFIYPSTTYIVGSSSIARIAINSYCTG